VTEVIRFTRLGKEDIRFGTSSFEVTLADGRVVTLTEVDVAALLEEFWPTTFLRLVDVNGTLIHAFGTTT
jgi:hypothetical protein